MHPPLDEDRPTGARRPRWLLLAGAATGLVLALASLFPGARNEPMPADAFAVVNGQPLRRDVFFCALGALAADRRAELGPEEQRLVLDRLIEEELLVQRARELGLHRHDRGVRDRLVEAMIDVVLADTQDEPADEEAVRAFYQEHAAFFAPVSSLHVRRVQFGWNGTRSRAEARQLATRSAGRLRSGEAVGMATDSAVPLPDGPVPVTKLRDYLGPSLTRRALELAPGEVSSPIEAGNAWHVLQVLSRRRGEPPPLESIEDRVRAEMRRRADDRALRAYLDNLREQAEIRIREP